MVSALISFNDEVNHVNMSINMSIVMNNNSARIIF